MEPTHQVTIRRREDFLALTVSCYGLRLRTGPPSAVLERTEAEALVVLEYPPQSLREQSSPAWSGGQPATVLAGRSRLVFRVPDEVHELVYDLPTLLGVVGFEPVLVDAAVGPDAALAAPGPVLGPPEPTQTAVELPQRLLFSPSAEEGWTHAIAPVAYDGRVELWHSRLGLRVRSGNGWRTDEYGGRLPTVRAVWARDDGLAGFLNDGDPSALEPEPFPSTFLPGNRDCGKIVWATANWREADEFTPRAFQAERLMLSAYGGWLSGRVVVEPPPGGALGLEQWTHRAAMGRDAYVRIVERGFLFPWGVPAASIQVAERQSVDHNGDRAAALVQKAYVVIRRPLCDYAALRSLDPAFDRGFPFKRIRFTTLTTPELQTSGKLGPETGDAILVAYPGGAPFEFSAIGTDLRDQEVPLALPSVFVPQPTAIAPGIAAALARWWGKPNSPNWVRGLGRRIAYTPDPGHDRLKPDDPKPDGASLETHFLITRLLETPPDTDVKAMVSAETPPWLPVVSRAVVSLAAAKGLSSGPLGTPAIKYTDDYLARGFEGVQNGIFAELDTALPLAFAGSSTGGLVLPDFSIQGLSRELGPIGDVDGLSGGRLNPAALFSSSARLLGAIGLAEIVAPAAGAQAAARSLRLTRQQLPDALETELLWNPELTADQHGVFEPGPSASFELHGLVRTSLGGGTATTRLDGVLTDVTLHFFGKGAGRCVSITFDKIHFSAPSGSAPVLEPVIRSVSFTGPLAFVDALRQYLSFGRSGPYVDLAPTRITAGVAVALPSLTVGVFTLQNLVLRTELQLSLTGEPARLRFAVCERARPFLLTVSLFGGGGFFALAMTTGGLELIEAALEFGASASVDLGVASGAVSVLAGIYFKLKKQLPPATGTETVLDGFFRLHGEMSVLGLISASLDFHLAIEYHDHGNGTYKVSGRATLHVEVSVFMFSTSVEVTCERRFGGTANDPGFTDQIAPTDWDEYCDAFAPLP